VVWTNRFPVSFLEGMEDLIQDPHKMYDEVLAIHYGTRRYLDTGEPLECRQPERCVHCFIEPYCTTMERAVTRQNEDTWDVWDVEGDASALAKLPSPLPFGITRVGASLPTMEAFHVLRDALPEGVGVYLRVPDAAPLPADLPAGSVLVAQTQAQCEAWLTGPLPDAVEEVEIRLNRDTAGWILSHRDALAALGERIRLVQPTHEHMKQASTDDIRSPRRFFATLDRPLRVSGLPVCNTPTATWVPDRAVLPSRTISEETGRFIIQELAGHHVRSAYRAKSSRCEDCRVDDRCDGMHLNMIRDQGLKLLVPLATGHEADHAEAHLTAIFPEPLGRIRHGMTPQPPAVSLYGKAQPESAPQHPLDVLDEARKQARAERLARAKALFAEGAD
jgi:hypothetical protein